MVPLEIQTMIAPLLGRTHCLFFSTSISFKSPDAKCQPERYCHIRDVEIFDVNQPVDCNCVNMSKRKQVDQQQESWSKNTPEKETAKRIKRHVPPSADPGVPPAPRYDFEPLIANDSELQKHAFKADDGRLLINFSSRAATLSLTRAILKHHFNLTLHLSPGQLVPTIPNRVQYLSWAIGLLPAELRRAPCAMLDIGTGPCCIYAMLAARLHPAWSFVATDVDADAITSATHNALQNGLTSIRIVPTRPVDGDMFPAAVRKARPVLSVCNPPFHDVAPQSDSLPGTLSQLVTQGGEHAFVRAMAEQSLTMPSVHWFTTLIGRKVDVAKTLAFLRSPAINAVHVKSVELSPGGKTVRWAIAWSFGRAQSCVYVLSHACEPWRLRIAVEPGRAFANQLLCSDVRDLCAVALVDIGWLLANRAKVNGHVYGNVSLSAVPHGDYAGAELDISVITGAERGQFVAHVKAERKGCLHRDSFKNLGGLMADRIGALLSEDNT